MPNLQPAVSDLAVCLLAECGRIRKTALKSLNRTHVLTSAEKGGNTKAKTGAQVICAPVLYREQQPRYRFTIRGIPPQFPFAFPQCSVRKWYFYVSALMPQPASSNGFDARTN